MKKLTIDRGFNLCCEVQETEHDKMRMSKQMEIMDECRNELFGKLNL